MDININLGKHYKKDKYKFVLTAEGNEAELRELYLKIDGLVPKQNVKYKMHNPKKKKR